MSESNLCNLYYAREASFGAAPPTRQSGTLTFSGVPASGQTVTIDGKVYTFRAAVAQLDTDGEVLLGATAALCATNLISAINLDPAGVGTLYTRNMAAPTRVYAATGGSGIVTVYATYPGVVLGLVAATQTLTGDATIVTANDTVTIDGKVYTFKAVVATEGDVLIAGTAALTLTNLFRAINHSGTPGTDYVCADQHPTVSATNPTATTVVVTARTAGTAGNSLASTEASTHLSWGAAALAGGTDDTIATTETCANAAWTAATLTGGTGVALAMQEIRFTGESFVPGKETVTSQEIRDRRTFRELVEVGLTSRGAVNVEMHHGGSGYIGLDEFLLSALMATEWSVGTFIQTSALSASGQTVVGATSWETLTGITSARYVKISGAATAANNGIKKVVSVVGSTITLASGSITADEASPTLTVYFRYARNGTRLVTYMLLKEYLSHSPKSSIACVGMFLNQFELTLQPKSIATASFTFGGARQYVSSGNLGAPAPTAPPNTSVINTSSNVGDIGYAGVAIAAPVMGLTLTVNNNLADRDVISSLTTISPRKGDCLITGTLNAYFKDKSLLDDFFAHTNRSIEFPLIDSSGNLLNFYLPTCSFSAAQSLIAGQNQDIMLPMTFQAIDPSDSGLQIQIDNLAA